MLKKILILSLAIIALTSIKAYAEYLCGSTGYIYRNQSFCNANCVFNGTPAPCENFTSSTTATPACPSGYEGFVFSPTTNKTYAVSTNSQFWTSFNNPTTAMTMAVISDSALNSLLSSILTYYTIPDAWIGLYNPQMSTDYNTVNPDRPYSWVNSSSLSYANWASGQPNNNLPNQDLSLLPESEYGQHWIEMESNGTWNDIGYNYTYPSSQNYAPYLPALVQFNNQLSCVSKSSTSTTKGSGLLSNKYCGGNTANCYLCSNGSKLAKCTSAPAAVPSSSSELCPYSESPCNLNTTTPYCPAGFTFSSGDCMKNVTQYTNPNCPSGYSYSNGTCSENVTQTAGATCPSGYTFNGSSCAEITYSCPSGGTLSGTTCSYAATATEGCPNSYIHNSNIGTCTKTTTTTTCQSEHACYSYCSDGKPYFGGSCPYSDRSEDRQCCTSNVTQSSSLITTYSCPSGGTLSGNICAYTATANTQTAGATCPSGYNLSNGTCYGNITQTAAPYCPYNYTLLNNTCLETTTQYAAPYCPSGTTLQNNQCISYYCPLGNSLSCINNGVGYYCSPFSCSDYNNSSSYTQTNANNNNNPTNNGATNSAGVCMGQVYIFEGQGMGCREPGLQTGLSNCCAASKTWFGIGKCNSSELLLATQKKAGNCTEVGSYCAESFIGICLQKKQSWCCFPSLLANIIQQQTRA
ncbi:MAG: conjugal transfer protein TraN, partial [bacterium]